MKKEMEREKAESAMVQDMYQENRREDIGLNEDYFYPKQTNKFPKYTKPGERSELDEQKQRVKEEIAQKRAEILTDEEYQ